MERQLLTRVPRAVLFVICSAGVVGSACSGPTDEGGAASAGLPSHSSTTPNSPTSSEAASPSADVGVILDVQPAEQAALVYAESVLTARCMQAVGFPFEALQYSAVLERMQTSAADAQRSQFPYVADVEGIPYEPIAEAAPFDPNVAYISSLDETARAAYGDALQGDIQDRVEVAALGNSAATPREGCVSEARTELYGSLEDALTSLILAGNLTPAAHSRARTDSDVVDAMKAWADCMRAVGFDFTEFGQARAAALARPEDADRIARADDQCTQESDLATQYATAFEQARDAVIEANVEQFNAATRARTVAIDQAERLLAEG